ncbi:MAG TPA: ABC transporter permease [Blastocatellia bacterium]|nr:ABC transporter permease [Blastocatellia bacterium]
MQTLWQDLRYGARMLLKAPGFTLIAVMTLALGIGANTAIFSLTDQILLRSLPVERPGELVVLRSPGPQGGYVWSDGDSAASFSYPMYKDLRDRGADVFSGLLARFAIPLSVAGAGQTGQAERADGELVSGNYFEVLGVRPALGRVFNQDDDRTPGAHQVVVLSHAYWTRRFGADPAILNKTLTVNGNLMTVIGVSREGFRGVQVGQTPDVFIPMTMKAQMIPNSRRLDDRRDYWLAIFGRLKPGVSRVQTEEAIRPAYRSILEEELSLRSGGSPEARQRFLDKRILLADGSKGRQILQLQTKQPFLILMGMAGLALLIACANVANLLLARGAARRREIAVRMALGAGRWRLMRQFLLESLMLSLIGGAVGLVVAAWTIQGLVAAIPPSAGALGLSAELDPRLLGFTLALSAITGLVFGVAPAARATRLNLESTLREQGSGVSGGLSSVRFRKALVVSQIVLTTVLLVGAGLFARSLNNLNRLDLGLRADHLIAFSVAPELNGYSPQRTIALFDDLRQGLAALPGVRSVGAAELPILTDSTAGSNMTIEGYQAQENEDMEVRHNRIGPDYFATMGIPLISGREFTVADAAGAPKVAIINETMARRFFANRNPIGSHFAFGAGDRIRPDIEIVGVVKDSKHATVREEKWPFAYLPYAQSADLGKITFYARTDQDVDSIAPSLRREVARRDNNLPIFDLKTFRRQADESLFTDRFVTILSICFGLLAATLAAIGLYGVMAYTVTRRIREIGIRIALGATQGRVAWLILREVALLALAGLLAGAPLAFALGRAAESILFDVKAGDPLVFAAASLLLGFVALLGGYLPARRAAKVDPMTALRRE